LDAVSGAEKWVFPTELPLGHSPTVHQQVVYVGGFDHKIYAIHALTGNLLWTFEAGAGFDTNPLVVQGMVLPVVDGYFYAPPMESILASWPGNIGQTGRSIFLQHTKMESSTLLRMIAGHTL
jgi:serine/threonine-protein kinase